MADFARHHTMSIVAYGKMRKIDDAMKTSRPSSPRADRSCCRRGELNLVPARVPSKQWHAIVRRLETGAARLLVGALLFWQAPVSRAADVAISLRLDADWVELIRAQRRAQGIDAPDAAADARFAAWLQRAQQQNGKAATPARQKVQRGAVAADPPFWLVVY
ncbi:hypothetical protein [Tahibacter aquaticus]|uniref:hypothetical protein n=1 Tax=Tahibacter aquaticus TaxID=520092 RepID=UPI00105F9575|nr:hypothetical protein [Tahibacter aquaticus]